METKNVLECATCGTTENIELLNVNGEELWFCEDCKNGQLKKCCDCDEYFYENKNDYVIDYHRNIYCETCRDNLSYCQRCEEYFDSSESFNHIVDSDEYWCESCTENNAYHCDSCGDYVSENHGNSEINLCRRCFENDYYVCEDCCELVNESEANFTDNGIYCNCCYENHQSNYIHNYSYQPTLDFQSSDKENEKRFAYLGFEIEAGGLSSLQECNEIAESISENDNEETFFLKEDGSIPEYGFELVSHPITLKRHKELNWKNILSEMASGGMKSHNLGQDSCGLHVHVSRNYLSSYKWLLIDWFISKHQPEFERIARRQESHWAKFKKSNGEPIKDVFGKSNGTRYQAVNFENRNTVEFRLFRGTLKYTTFMATLEIVDALVRWAKQLSISDILASKNAFGNFTKYIITNGELYENAVNYLKEKNLI